MEGFKFDLFYHKGLFCQIHHLLIYSALCAGSRHVKTADNLRVDVSVIVVGRQRRLCCCQCYSDVRLQVSDQSTADFPPHDYYCQHLKRRSQSWLQVLQQHWCLLVSMYC